MTRTIQETVIKIDSLSGLTPELLQSAMAYYRAVRHTANRCSHNFEWLYVGESEFIPCLDTQIIFVALIGVRDAKGIARQAQRKLQPSRATGTGGKLHDLQRISGPHVLRYYLETLQRFTLPPGTVAEILAIRPEIRTRVNEVAQQLLGLVSHLEQKKDAAETVSNSQWEELFAYRQVGQILRDNLERLLRDLDGLNLLEKVERASTPFESLLGRVEEGSDPQTRRIFDEVLRHLMFDRCDYPRSNLCDAWNCASVAQLFQASLQHGRRRFLPALVTNTRAVLQGSPIIQAHLASQLDLGQMPDLVVDSAYLTFAEGLVDMASIGSRGDASMIDAKRLADLLAADAFELDRLCMELLRLLERSPSHSAGRCAEIEGLAELIAHQFMRFEKSWSAVVSRHDQLIRSDVSMLVDQLLTPRLDWLLRTGPRSDTRRIADELRSKMMETVHPHDPRMDLWKLLLQCAGQRTDPLKSVPLLPGFRFVLNEVYLISARPHHTMIRRDLLR